VRLRVPVPGAGMRGAGMRLRLPPATATPAWRRADLMSVGVEDPHHHDDDGVAGQAAFARAEDRPPLAGTLGTLGG
jgi:hypothetical protein